MTIKEMENIGKEIMQNGKLYREDQSWCGDFYSIYEDENGNWVRVEDYDGVVFLHYNGIDYYAEDYKN